LDDANTLVKVRAAAALAPVDPQQARRAFASALGDPNPAVRAGTARALIRLAAEHPDATDPATLRPLLRDADAWIRLSAAAALRSLARAQHYSSSSGRG
jgi:HEAT repeat protein